MRNYMTVSFVNTGMLWLLLLVFLGVSGCAGVTSTIPRERWVPLTEAENNQGDFSYDSLTVKYSYSLTGNSLISGGSNMILAGKVSYRGGFDSLDINILFLDAGGTVLQQKFIYSSGYRDRSEKVSNLDVQKTFVVPAGSAAITFTYSVMERSGGRK